MRLIFSLSIVLFVCHIALAQSEQDHGIQQQLEVLGAHTEEAMEDDSYLQHLQYLQEHPLYLNSATENDLNAFLLLQPLQIHQFLLYRKHFGKLISIYELQAIPGWDIATIQKIRSYVTMGEEVADPLPFIKQLTSGAHILLGRISQTLEKAKGFIAKDTGTAIYSGSPQKILLRYRYQYKNKLQYGLLCEKDAGETLFRAAQKQGFDFYSFHLFVNGAGMTKYLAIGDFKVNMGQGLINWQSMAFKKSVNVMGIKREAAVLQPYHTAGEDNFYRGIGVTLQKNHWQGTAFISYRKRSAILAFDSLNAERITSIQNSGYHRTLSEIANKNRFAQLTLGSSIVYQRDALHIGINSICHFLSKRLQRNPEIYNIYAPSGKSLINTSIDYSYTFRNMHLFGEVAVNAQKNLAMTHGLMMSLDTKADLSLLYRNIAPAYNSMYGNAFTENATVTNENGYYVGLEFRPVPAIRVDMYADIFYFPWLKYDVSSPSRGKDYMLQCTWKPNKETECAVRYHSESKAINIPGGNQSVPTIQNYYRRNLRMNILLKLAPIVRLNTRADLVWLQRQPEQSEHGFLGWLDLSYKPSGKRIGADVRLQYFETDSYDSRIYAYESDVLYGFSVPSFFDKGLRYYVNLNYDISKTTGVWCKIAQTVYSRKTTIGSGYDMLEGNHKTEIKLQIVHRW